MIELAPNHKSGLSVANPILLAGGSIGYGEAMHPILKVANLGAVVVGPLLMHSRAGSPATRFGHVAGGFVIDSGLQNRGLSAVVRNFGRLWSRLGCPVIVQVAETNPRYLPTIVQQLEVIDGVAGVELLVPEEVEKRTLKPLIRTIVENCDLPLWVKLPLTRAEELAMLCVQYEAVGLVLGSFSHTIESHESTIGNERRGQLYGPVVFSTMFDVLQKITQHKLDCALIACGGIYNGEHVKLALSAGAQAVQIDSALWVEPGLPEKLAQQFALVSQLYS